MLFRLPLQAPHCTEPGTAGRDVTPSTLQVLILPAQFALPSTQPPSEHTQITQECVLTKSFGTATNTTLTVFDTSLKVSASELTAQITAELKNLLSVLGKSS